MKIKLNIKNVLVLSIFAIIFAIISLFFINISFASNTAKVLVETANLREAPSQESKILELINKNEKVEILEKADSWSKVKYKGLIGYLRNDLIKNQEENSNNVDNNNSSNQNKEENINKQENVESKIQEENVENGKIKGKYKLKEDTNLKVIPLINSLDIDNLKKGDELEVIDVMNNWANVIINQKQGWVVLEKLEKVEINENKEQKPEQKSEIKKEEEKPKKEEKPKQEVKVTSKNMYVNSQTVNLRSKADRNSNLIMQLAINTKVEVVAEENGWSKIKVNGKEGYILSSLLSNKKQETSRGMDKPRNQEQKVETKEENKKEENNNQSNKGASVVSYAKNFLNVRYSYGGTSPKTGFDCSGFTSYVYRHFGISLPRTAEAQATVGKPVSRGNLMPGDLVCYRGHVAIYVGGGNVIHAPRPGKSICIVPINNAGYGFIGGRRVL